jgi:hypothetical protein
MTVNFRNKILLMGAGFTANFGGLLAREMWAKIFNNRKLDQLPEVKKMLKENFDFESVYSQVLKSSITEKEKMLFQEVISESYDGMDFTIKSFIHSGFRQYGVWWAGVSNFLGLFKGTSSEPGGLFTLNQDLLLERAMHTPPLGINGVRYRDYREALNIGQLDPVKNEIILPNSDELQNFIDKDLASFGDLHFIKLHGSQGWRSSSGSAQLILGVNKLVDIQKEPLLNWYLELFKQAINNKGVKLVVLGYSFRDEHINDILVKAVEEHGLKLIIISTESPNDFKDRMEGRPKDSSTIWEVSKNKKIWDAVDAYFQHSLKSIFPPDQSETETFKDIKKLVK